LKLSLNQARAVVLNSLPAGSTVESQIIYDDKYMFVAYRPDPLEGRLDPFFYVEPNTGHFQDFKPADYPKPIEIYDAFEAAWGKS
jgi:hypothetical protein